MAKRKASKSDSSSMNMQKAIRMVIDSGTFSLGFRTAKKKAMSGVGKIILISSNAPKDEVLDLTRYCNLSKLTLYIFDGTSLELGSICGKPFPVSAMWISNVGDSPLMTIINKK